MTPLRTLPQILAVCGLAPALAAQTVYHETEPNNGLGSANGPFVMNPGDTLVGNSRGTTFTPGPESRDYFVLQAPPAPPGIYRQRLTLGTAGAPGHSGTLRGAVSGSSEATIQTSTSPGALQWYGVGQSERMYFRVTGSAATPDDYTASLESTPVTPTDLGTFPGGFLVITTLGQGHNTDTDLWVYDASLSPIPNFGNDQEPSPGTSDHARLARDFTSAGVYYLAIAAFDLTHNLRAAPDERRALFTICAFPGATLSSSSTSAQNLSFVITDNTGASHPVAAASAEPFHVLWYRFSLADPALGACCRPDGSCSDGGSSGYCASIGGIYQGDGVVCGSVSCPQPPAGACCFYDGSCAQVSSFVCAPAGGLVWHGAGSLCSQTVCTPSPACYPNCDGSTSPPAVNVADFTCFLQKFAAQSPYTNCDASTTPPIFNVADYTCFLQRFAAGCSAP
jgi:hypothetical protein